MRAAPSAVMLREAKSQHDNVGNSALPQRVLMAYQILGHHALERLVLAKRERCM